MAAIDKNKEYALINSCDLWWGREVVEVKKDKVEVKGVNGDKGPVVYGAVLCSKEIGEELIKQITALYEEYKKQATASHETYKNLVKELIKDL